MAVFSRILLLWSRRPGLLSKAAAATRQPAKYISSKPPKGDVRVVVSIMAGFVTLRRLKSSDRCSCLYFNANVKLARVVVWKEAVGAMAVMCLAILGPSGWIAAHVHDYRKGD